MSVKQKRIVEREDKMEKYLGENIPKLGFGLMRLPMDEGKIDVARTQEMVDRFLEEGFCYFDTAYGYNDGESEAVAKKVLSDRYPRDKFLLATKLPAWAGAKSREEAEQQVIKKARDMYASFLKVPCTSCAYCMKGCPKQIGIHGIFQAYNLYTMYHDLSGARNKYQWNTEGRGFAKASACIRCGKCEQVCPQHIHIRDELARAAEALEG